MPERRFMICNLHIISGNPDERATEEQAEEALIEILKKICSPLESSNPLISIQEHGYMPDEESDKDERYWVTFIVDPPTADTIHGNRRGLMKEIQKMNELKWGNERKEKHTRMRIYRGVQFEAIQKTLRSVKRILEEETFPERDGFKITFGKQVIQIFYEKGNLETLSIENVIDEHWDVFREAVKKLDAAERESIDNFVELHHRKARKRALVGDDTISNAASPPTPKMVRFANPIEKMRMISPVERS
ncbi:hypothetical protein GCK72_008696 [Caenorhabditis remanei]|uniref:Uncharacterized protein n=1 Tax=Caenorhabditis remanei TaxID=31234 RepID=A0A6A5GZE4_CAERE|nr:hypothetical protein GCK72_008696 [Caenorhabditis remanei]KAF1760447.1 hypothetical protein GCK72_008696 [Caenorhabditis remanei]